MFGCFTGVTFYVIDANHHVESYFVAYAVTKVELQNVVGRLGLIAYVCTDDKMYRLPCGDCQTDWKAAVILVVVVVYSFIQHWQTEFIQKNIRQGIIGSYMTNTCPCKAYEL